VNRAAAGSGCGSRVGRWSAATLPPRPVRVKLLLSVRDYVQTRLTLRPAPGVQTSPKEQQEAFASSGMEWFRSSLHLPGTDGVRAAILDDLSTHSWLTSDQCVERCRNWESWSADGWCAADRSGVAGLTDFCRTTESWAFGLL
jgi:hypothetical protein